MTQFLTRHGFFLAYLFKIGKVWSPACVYFGAILDDVEHMFLACSRWSDKRTELERRVGCLTPEYLGLVFDSNTRRNEHIVYVYYKTKYLIFIFYKLMKIISTDCLRMVYYDFFHSIISDGMIAWGGVYSNSINFLKRLKSDY